MAIFNSYVKLPEGNILVITVVITNIVHKWICPLPICLPDGIWWNIVISVGCARNMNGLRYKYDLVPSRVHIEGSQKPWGMKGMKTHTHTDRYIYICIYIYEKKYIYIYIHIWDHRMGVFHTRGTGWSGNFQKDLVCDTDIFGAKDQPWTWWNSYLTFWVYRRNWWDGSH